MKKLKEVREAILNPPPGRLERIEYRSHFMQIIGVSVVCGILISRGLWYIIFAFIFSVGVSYSQGIKAHQRYKALMQYQPEEDFSKDKSPTRRRDFIIKKVLGKYSWIIAAVISVVLTFFFIPRDTWYMKALFGFMILTIYLVTYFILFYFIAKPIYNRMKKGGKKK